MHRATLIALTWATVFAAVTSALLLAATDRSTSHKEAVTGAVVETLIERAATEPEAPAAPAR